MERAGFIGMRRKIRELVKQTAPAKTSAGLFLPSKDSVPTSIHLASESDQKSPPGKPSLDVYEHYLRSYGDSHTGPVGAPADPQEVEGLLKCATDVKYRDGLGWSLLHFAAEGGAIDALKKLLELRADPNAVNCLSRSPLHLAVIRDEPDIVTELLTYGANANLEDADGWTPVHFAVHLGHLRSLQAVLAFSPDLHVRNKSLKTPKDYIKCPLVHAEILSFEHKRKESGQSQDSVETADVSLAESPHLHSDHTMHFSKMDGHDRAEHRSPVTIVRAQRPNEESGAIVCPHPNSAYS